VLQEFNNITELSKFLEVREVWCHSHWHRK